jgi:uncharacterized protein YaaN involved in tellurite resistance
MTSLHISAEAYERMLRDEGIITLVEERDRLKDRNLKLEQEHKVNVRRITALTSTIAALHLIGGGK